MISMWSVFYTYTYKGYRGLQEGLQWIPKFTVGLHGLQQDYEDYMKL